MSFANPALLLAGLACVAIPILIHILMRRRRKPVSWGAMQWLMEAYRQQRRRTRLEQLLLLASRCVLVALVALALGKPLLGSMNGAQGSRPRTLYLLIDNSLTAQAVDSSEEALARHQARAEALLADLDAAQGDRAALIALSTPARGVVLPASSDLAEVRQQLKQLRTEDGAADVLGAASAVRSALAQEQAGTPEARDHVVALLSDAREGSYPLTQPLPSLEVVGTEGDAGAIAAVRVLASAPATATLANTGIASIEPLTSLVLGGAGGAGEGSRSVGEAASASAALVPVRITLVRSGDNSEQAATVRVWLTDARTLMSQAGAARGVPSEAARGVVSWASGQRTASVTVSASLLPGAATGGGAGLGELVIVARIDDDAIGGDNIASRPIEARGTLQVALVGPASDGASGVQAFTPRDWFSLALAPRSEAAWAGAAGIRVTRLEARDFVGLSDAGQGVPALLRGVSAVVVTEPQLLDASAWRALRAASAGGVAIVVVPPEDEQAQTWADAMQQALGTPWTLARASTPVDGEGLTSQAQVQGEDDLLSLIRPELDELVRSVRIARIVRTEGGLTNAHALLALRDGTPLIVAARAQIGSMGSGLGKATGPAAGRATDSSRGGTGGWVVVWLATPSLGWMDLPAKPLMVPLVQELIRQAVGRSAARRDTLAGARVASPGDAVDVASAAKWRRSEGEVVPVSPELVLRDAGVWLMRNAQGQTITSVAVNSPHQAGNTTPLAESQVLTWLGGLSRDVRVLEDASGTGQAPASGASGALARRENTTWTWSLWLLLAAVGVAVVEAVLARWFSHAGVRSGVRSGGGERAGGTVAQGASA